MRKLFIAIQWVVVLAFASTAIYLMVRPEPRPEHNPQAWNSWRGFFTISYLGVTRDDDARYVSEARLDEQLRVLREAGYLTITPDDAAAFLAARAPLPEKALLVLFEGGRKDSFLRATPVLRRHAQLATLCLPTEVTTRYGAFYLDKQDLRRIAGLAHWRLCSMGHESLQPVPVNAQGSTGHFLARHQWLDGRAETAEEFRQRVERDFDIAARMLEGANDGPVAAYAFPYADWSTAPGSDSAAARVNRQAAAAHHRIAFVDVGSAFNGFGADPYNLRRLRVSGQWSAQQLLDELASFAPREDPVVSVAAPGTWTLAGGARPDGTLIRLPTDATAWIRGSDAWSDSDATAAVALGDADAIAALYARHAGPASYLRVVLTADGVQLQERVGGETRALAALATATAAGVVRSLRLRVKGRRAWAWVDDGLVGGPVPVAGATGQGATGLGSQRGAVSLSAFTARPVRADFVFAGSFSSLDDAEREAAVAVLRPWDSTAADPGLERDVLQAAAGGVETIPLFDAPTPEAALTQAAKLADSLQGPILSRLVTRVAVRGPGNEFIDALRGHGYRIIRVVTPTEALRLTPADGVAPTDLLLLEGPSREIRAVLDELLHRVPAIHIIASVAHDDALPAWTRRAVRAREAAQP